jgi:hypothetical protein
MLFGEFFIEAFIGRPDKDAAAFRRRIARVDA